MSERSTSELRPAPSINVSGMSNLLVINNAEIFGVNHFEQTSSSIVSLKHLVK